MMRLGFPHKTSVTMLVRRPLLPLLFPVFEWVKDEFLKYQSSITSLFSIGALLCQLELAKLGDTHKITLVACGEDKYLFMCSAPDCPPFFYVYQCMFKVLNLNNFQCALQRHLNIAHSQLNPNNQAMVQAFEILCPFFNIRLNITVFMHFFQIKQTRKTGQVSLNNISNKMFEFDSNTFHRFKECFFKVKATYVVSDRLSLLYEENGEPHFPFNQQLYPARFKSFKVRLISSEEMVDKAILKRLLALLDARAILFLP